MLKFKILHIPTGTYLLEDRTDGIDYDVFIEAVFKSEEAAIHALEIFVIKWGASEFWTHEQNEIRTNNDLWFSRCASIKYSVEEFLLMEFEE